MALWPGGGGFSASLRVTVTPGGETTRITCESPADSTACQRLARLEPDAFAPPSGQQVCTQIYGGPAVATVTGTLRGERVRARFDRRNGCAIARWDRFAWLIGEAPAFM